MAVAEVCYQSALSAGAVSFLSPCVLPLVPPYLCYMAGVSVDEFRNPDLAGNAGVASRRNRPISLSSGLCQAKSSRPMTP